MKGYLIANYTIHDPNTYQKYAERTGRSPAAAPSQHGNRYLPRFHAPGLPHPAAHWQRYSSARTGSKRCPRTLPCWTT